MANSTLAAIQTKVRRLTRSPNESQLTTAQLNEYINTFILYNFPSNLRLFNLRQLLTFYTQPNVDQYATNTTDPNNALYNFKNKYITVHPPVFLAGIQGFYTQWRDVFYGYYPQTQTIADTLLRGDGTTGPFAGNITGHPMLQNDVIVTCLDQNGTAMILVDYPVDNIIGAFGKPNNTLDLSTFPFGQINYITGDFTVTFPNATETQAIIYAENVPYQPGKPLAVLYYNDTFTIRPVPDKVYSVQLEVDVQPTELLQSTDHPDLDQWWQYISFGSAKLVFEDRLDMDSVQMIMPEFKAQESKVLRTTLCQQANERTVTIYTQGKSYNWGGWGGVGWPY